MIIRQNKDFETNSQFLNSNWYEDQPDNYVVDETTPEGQALAEKIKSLYPMYDLVITDGVLGGVIEIPLISISSDKSQILSDGLDTATITATVADNSSTETITFTVDEVDYPIQAINGLATLQVTCDQPGTLEITARSSTKYGQNSITLEVV